MTAFKSMSARPGLKTCFDGLRSSGWDVYAVTNGGSEVSLKYFHSANIELDAEHLLSCDAIKVAKPDLRVYETAKRHLEARGVGDGEKYFVAAHAWDLIAARKAGYKTAYLDFEEHDPVTEVFGEFDVYATSMEDLLGKLRDVAK
jgi:2-haloacid dehalogenase